MAKKQKKQSDVENLASIVLKDPLDMLGRGDRKVIRLASKFIRKPIPTSEARGEVAGYTAKALSHQDRVRAMHSYISFTEREYSMMVKLTKVQRTRHYQDNLGVNKTEATAQLAKDDVYMDVYLKHAALKVLSESLVSLLWQITRALKTVNNER